MKLLFLVREEYVTLAVTDQGEIKKVQFTDVKIVNHREMLRGKFPWTRSVYLGSCWSCYNMPKGGLFKNKNKLILE